MQLSTAQQMHFAPRIPLSDGRQKKQNPEMLAHSGHLLITLMVIFPNAGGSDELRLVNDGDACSGRVEISHGNRWGTICKSDWDFQDAEVVCRQLGCGSPVNAKSLVAHLGDGSWSVWLSKVECKGTESTLFDCPHAPWGYDDCSKKRDIAVRCTESRKLDPKIYKVPLSVDVKTAHRSLILTGDGKEVTGSKTLQDIPHSPVRYDINPCVAGSVGMTSGKLYGEVTITSKDSGKDGPLEWILGVTAESNIGKVSFYRQPKTGYWAIHHHAGFTRVLDEEASDMQFVATRLQKLGIYVDYDEGIVSFYNADNGEHLHTFTDKFTEKLFTYLCVYPSTTVQLS